jgi:hypothetical protein
VQRYSHVSHSLAPAHRSPRNRGAL